MLSSGRRKLAANLGLRSRRWAGLGLRAGCALAAFVAAIALAMGVRHGVQVTSRLLSRPSISKHDLADARDMCIYQAIRRELPEGAAFYDSGANTQYYQRLAELATLWAVPRPTPGPALWRVAIVPGHCAGIAVKAWHG